MTAVGSATDEPRHDESCCMAGVPADLGPHEDCPGVEALRPKQRAASSPQSPSVTDAGETYGAVTGGNGRSPLPCPTCGLPTWDGLHATGHRACFMSEVPGV